MVNLKAISYQPSAISLIKNTWDEGVILSLFFIFKLIAER
jgi:hypothetical protein